MAITNIRAADLYRHLDPVQRPALGHWLEQLRIYSAGTIEGHGLATVMDRQAAEYEINAYCHGSPEVRDAALGWLDGLEVITDADLRFMQETADAIDAALEQDAALWEAQDEVQITAAGVHATQRDAQRLEPALALEAGFMQGFTNVRSLTVDQDLLRMDGEDVRELLQRLEAFGEAKVQVMVHRHLGCSVPVWVGALGHDGVKADELAAAVRAEWERLQKYDAAVAEWKGQA